MTFGFREHMKCRSELTGSQFSSLNIVAISFVDDNAVGHFHNTSLDALQLITRASQLYQQEEIHH